MADCIPGVSTTQRASYTDGDTPDRLLRQHVLVPAVVGGYDLYNDSFGDTSGFYLVTPQETTNLLKNPTFFRDLWSWDVFNVQMERTNQWAYDSGWSIRLRGSGDDTTAERREYVEAQIDNWVVDQIYTFSMYAWLPFDWDLSDPYVGVISIVQIDGIGGETETFSDKPEHYAMWNRLSVTAQILDTTEQVFVRLNLRSQDARSNNPPDYLLTGDYNLVNEYAYFDYGQFEAGADATLPFHGDYRVCQEFDACEGYYWVGVPHRSASVRTACARDSGVLVSLGDLGMQVLNHTGHGAPPVRDISAPYANKPGEFYEKTAVDARVLTFTVAFCGTLKELECNIFGLGEHIFPDTCSCRGKFLLVYKRGACDDDTCNVDHYLALCVTYIGGMEGIRDNLYQQRMVLQFKAHQPFWFSWPGHKSAGLSFNQFSHTQNVVKWHADGSITNLPLSGGLDLTAVACMPGNRTLVAGSFDSPNGATCTQNVAIFDCDIVCDGYAGTADRVTAAITDGAGNAIVGTESGQLVIYYAYGGQGSFPGYPNGGVNALAAPFWAQIAVGTDTGVYIELLDGTWLSYPTDNPVYALAVENNGNLIAGGDFTTIGGVSAIRIARYNVNVNGCLDADSAIWEPFDFGFDGRISTIAVDPRTGAIYIGGTATQTIPTTQDTCAVTEGTSYTSSGSNQEVRFTDLGGGVYRLEFQLANIIAREKLVSCTSYIRVTATSSLGTKYNFLFGTYNIVAGPTVGTAGPLFTVSWDIDTGVSIGDPCATLDAEFTTELAETADFLPFVTPLALPGGVGIDNELSSVVGQCLTVTTQFTAESVTFQGIAKIIGNTVVSLGDGVPTPVNDIMVHPDTGEIWVAFDSPSAPYRDGLAIWDGTGWKDFPGYLGGGSSRSVLQLAYCGNDCSVLILFEGAGHSLLPGVTEIDYTGSAANHNAELVLHGPGKVEYYNHNGTGKRAYLCLELQCDEVARLNYGSGSLTSNFRNQLGSSILSGSRLDVCLGLCDNNFSIFIDPENTDASTAATLLWRDYHWGIEALCCSDDRTPPDIPPENCCSDLWERGRDPNDQDCKERGYSIGDYWYNGFGACNSLWINVDDSCPVCEDNTGFVSGEGEILTTPDGEIICPELPTDCV